MSSSALTLKLRWTANRVADLLHHEGPRGLLKGIGRLLYQKRRQIVSSERFVIYVTETVGHEASLVAPPTDGLEVHILHSEKDVERLVAAGYEDVRRVVRPAGRRLRMGGIGFCAFVKRKVAQVNWVAPTADAKPSIDAVPCRVKFSEGEACSGGALTLDRFRGLGLHSHVMALRLQYCRAHGCTALVAAERQWTMRHLATTTASTIPGCERWADTDTYCVGPNGRRNIMGICETISRTVAAVLVRSKACG